ncbi:MAG: hypothetical protein CVV44_13240 [Spirochaetae bacterium HGW-Spirochaetae-1]|nr:MAG: hypothetical protein CVV44_13240 [Spirochaetae bacterium HGW-Spirochaetae-1]
MISAHEAIINILFPSWCLNCGIPVSSSDRHLCVLCREKIEFVHNACPVCSGFVMDGVCLMCGNREIFFKKNIAIMEYTGVAKEILHHFKFSGKKRLSRLLGGEALKAWESWGGKADMVTSVPMNPVKEWKRGYNQSKLVAQHVAKNSSIPYRDIMREKKDSKTQREQGYYNRFFNVLDRYFVKDTMDVTNKTILLVDDVFTTGATLNECSRIIRDAGAKAVFCLTLARAGIKKLEK